jgi:hypothetical protein
VVGELEVGVGANHRANIQIDGGQIRRRDERVWRTSSRSQESGQHWHAAFMITFILATEPL